MKGSTRTNLRTARSLFRRCAQKLEATRVAGASLPQLRREMQVGFGLCADWQRWAAALDDLSFSTRSEERSSRAQGLTETTRFSYIWIGTNSLFSRDSILTLAVAPGALPAQLDEARRFRILYDFAQLPSALVMAEHTLLNNILSMQCQAQPLPGAPPRPSYTMWEVIFYKYIVTDQRRRGVGRSIAAALAAGQLPILDAPAIIYAARNWNVHGVLISSSFRGSRQKHMTFVDSITLLLSEVLARAATKFDALL